MVFLSFIQNLILEAAKQVKNLHLEHLEDEVFNGGVDGTRRAVTLLLKLRDKLLGKAPRIDITTKWDGAPAIFAGINPENQRFFVGTKSVFAKNAKLNYTPDDISTYYSESPGLAHKLQVALKYLPRTGVGKSGPNVLQGDMLYTYDDLHVINISDSSYVTFQPNTIVYAVPTASTLAKRIIGSKMGVVWHTSYYGDTMEGMKASFGADSDALQPTKDVWFQDAAIRTLEPDRLDEQELGDLMTILSGVGKLFKSIPADLLNKIRDDETIKGEIKIFNNDRIKRGEGFKFSNTTVSELIEQVNSRTEVGKLSPKKRDYVVSFLQENEENLNKIFNLHAMLYEAKIIILENIEAESPIEAFLRTDEGLSKTQPEGFVVIDADERGKAVKLVDRLGFSRSNFLATKAWGSPNV